MSLFFERPGILTTIQDAGRYGYRRFGINPGGVMDPAAPRLLNTLLGDPEDTSVLEMHFPAPSIVFETGATAAVGGADFAPHLDDAPLRNWQTFTAEKGSKLTFTQKRTGNRAYLAVRGGINGSVWLGSSSTDLKVVRGGLSGRRIKSGDRIKLNERLQPQAAGKVAVSPWAVPRYGSSVLVRVLPGAEFKWITDPGRRTFLNGSFTISRQADRMGFRLIGEPIESARTGELVSTAVAFGTIQLLPQGQMIILMADHQTTGGYPRLGNIISCDLPLVAQLGPNDGISFTLVSIDEAEAAILEWERDLNFLRAGCKLLTTPT